MAFSRTQRMVLAYSAMAVLAIALGWVSLNISRLLPGQTGLILLVFAWFAAMKVGALLSDWSKQPPEHRETTKTPDTAER